MMPNTRLNHVIGGRSGDPVELKDKLFYVCLCSKKKHLYKLRIRVNLLIKTWGSCPLLSRVLGPEFL